MIILSLGMYFIMVFAIKNKLRVQFISQPPSLDCEKVIDDYGPDL